MMLRGLEAVRAQAAIVLENDPKPLLPLSV
jgi:hypothetical protein